MLAVLGSVVSEWSDVGGELGVPQSVLRRITKDHTTCEDRKQEMSLYWLTVVPRASWAALASALFCHRLEAALVNVKPHLEFRRGEARRLSAVVAIFVSTVHYKY